MFVLGVTGPIASGKTTFCNGFKKHVILPGVDTSTIPIINTDNIWKDILADKTRTDVHLLLVTEFGTGITNEYGFVTKEKLAEFLYKPETHTVKTITGGSITIPVIRHQDVEKLQEIAWPIIEEKLKKTLDYYKSINTKFVILDTANLFTSSFYKYCDAILIMKADENTRMLRLSERENIKWQEAKHRIKLFKSEQFNASDYWNQLSNTKGRIIDTSMVASPEMYLNQDFCTKVCRDLKLYDINWGEE